MDLKFKKSEEEKNKLNCLLKEKDLQIERFSRKVVKSVDTEENDSDKAVVARTDTEETDSDTASVAKIQGLKSRIEKYSENKKLTPREIVFRSIRHLDVNEIFENTSETEFKCLLKVKVDSSKLLVNKVFTAVAPTKKKCLVAAYSEVISFLKSC